MGADTFQLYLLGLGYTFAAFGIIFREYALTALLAETILVVVVAMVDEGVLFSRRAQSQTESKHSGLVPQAGEDAPLSKEEEEAVRAAKRIVAKAREGFLKENNGYVPMASAKVQTLMKDAADVFLQNLDSGKSSEGQTWTLQYSDEKRELKIFSATFPGQSCRRWKVETILDSDLESAYDASFVPEKRRKWDALVKDIRMLQINDCSPEVGDGLAITTILTNAVMVVSSRSMLDIALQRCQRRGGIVIANVSCPADFAEMKLDPGLRGTVRAKTLIGSGALIEAIPGRPGKLKYVLVSTIDLGGWLPPSVVNAAFTTSLAQSTIQMQDYLARKS